MTTATLKARIDLPAVPASASRSAAVNVLAARVPFRGPAAPRGNEQARVSGEIPAWLRGDLVRVAPWFDATPNWSPSHWFDALGLVFGFEIGAGAVNLRWAVLDCDVGAAAASGKVPFAHFATSNQRGPLKRLLQPIPDQTDNTNVNVVRMGDEWVALTETPTQYALDPKSLAVRGPVKYHDALGGAAMLAHPIRNGDTITNLSIRFGRRAELVLFDYATHGRSRRIRASWKTPEVPYVHSFGLTERTGVILDHPLRLRPQTLLWSNRGIVEHLVWNPTSPARLILLDRETGRASAHETDPLFSFHIVHTFETADELVVDLVAYDDAKIISALWVTRLAEGFAGAPSRLIRLTVDRRTGRVARRVLYDVPLELPQVDWERVNGGPERIVFGTNGLAPDGTHVQSTILRLDLDRGESRSFSDPDYVFGEPLFVGAPDRREEGEGVLLAVGSSERGAALFVLDATTLDVCARAEVETHIPLGFHGNFLPA